MNTLKKPYIIQFTSIAGQQRSALTVATSQEEIPFPVQRIYWIHGSSVASVRGGHANKANQQVVVVLNGSATAVLTDHTGEKHKYELTTSDKGLYVPPMYWRDFYVAPDTVLLCIASEKFDERDYIRDYEAFRKQHD